MQARLQPEVLQHQRTHVFVKIMLIRMETPSDPSDRGFLAVLEDVPFCRIVPQKSREARTGVRAGRDGRNRDRHIVPRNDVPGLDPPGLDFGGVGARRTRVGRRRTIRVTPTTGTRRQDALHPRRDPVGVFRSGPLYERRDAFDVQSHEVFFDMTGGVNG